MGFSNDTTTITIDSTPEKAKTLVMQATCISCGFTHQQKKPLLLGSRYEITEEAASRQPCPTCHGKFAKFSEEDTLRYPNEILNEL
jgi:Zn finger protein HypA/HybF involved in hydrogenase expression